MKNVFLLYRYTGTNHEEHESLYFQPFYDIYGDDILDDAMINYIKQNEKAGYWRGEGSPLEIKYMEEMLERLKKEGATHMEIMYHCDHDSYSISGVEIRKPTQEEIDNQLTKEKNDKEAELLAKKKRIQEAMDEVNKELENLG